MMTRSTSELRPWAIRLPAPGVTGQASGLWFGVIWSPSWTRATMALTPARRRRSAARLPEATSSSNFSPAMPAAVTIVGVVCVTRPMKPTLTPLIFLMATGGSAYLSLFSLRTLAARYSYLAPFHLPAGEQPSVGWQPPFWMRLSSVRPSSNSWLPTEETSRPSLPSSSTVGSSWYAAEISGEAPIRSPAATTAEFLLTSDLRWVAR